MVVVCWSGGIDSTALLAQLLAHGYNIKPVTYTIYGGPFAEREARARELLYPILGRLAISNRGTLQPLVTVRADWIWNFSPDGIEIPMRNRLILSHLVANQDAKDFGMGEYVGADTWVTKDHVAGQDADARALSSYLYLQHGMGYRLLTLSDFGEARYKDQRLKMGFDVIGDGMYMTTNCLYNELGSCGECYKCAERRSAFIRLGIEDRTDYAVGPSEKAVVGYLDQMAGRVVCSVVLPPVELGRLPQPSYIGMGL